MDKYELYRSFKDRVVKVVIDEVGDDEEYMLLIAVVLQAIQDAMGLYLADANIIRAYIVPEERRSCHQEDAVRWFRGRGHWLFCDICGVEPTWITWWLKNKAGVEI